MPNISLTPIIRENANATKLMKYCKDHEHDICKILTKEEEQALIQEWKDKDPEKLRQMLIMHNVALVFNMAAKYMMVVKSFDENVQNGLYGLTYAARKFDLNQTKTKFSTYAYFWIYKYVWYTYWKDTLDKDDPLNNGVSLDSSVSEYASNSKSDDSDGGGLGNYLENHLDPNTPSLDNGNEKSESLSVKSLFEDLRKYMLTDDFSDVDRLVFNQSFVDDSLSLRKISSDFDIPIREVKTSYDRILSMMKTKLSEMNIHSMGDIIAS